MSYHSARGRSSLGVVLVRDHRAGAAVPEYVRRDGETRAQAQARANADPAAAAAEAARYKPGYTPPVAPDGSLNTGGAPSTIMGIPLVYALGGAGLLAFLFLRRKKSSATVVPSP